MLSDRIIKEKKKVHDLTTKTSLLSNYYNVIKGKQVIEEAAYEQSDTCEDTFGKKERPKSPHRKISNWINDNFELRKYRNLLQNKLQIIRESLYETKD